MKKKPKRVTKKRIDRLGEKVCEALQKISEKQKGKASKKDWMLVWNRLNEWKEACSFAGRSTSKGLECRIAFDLCQRLIKYDHTEHHFAKHEFWETIWWLLDRWVTRGAVMPEIGECVYVSGSGYHEWDGENWCRPIDCEVNTHVEMIGMLVDNCQDDDIAKYADSACCVCHGRGYYSDAAQYQFVCSCITHGMPEMSIGTKYSLEHERLDRELKAKLQ